MIPMNLPGQHCTRHSPVRLREKWLQYNPPRLYSRTPGNMHRPRFPERTRRSSVLESQPDNPVQEETVTDLIRVDSREEQRGDSMLLQVEVERALSAPYAAHPAQTHLR